MKKVNPQIILSLLQGKYFKGGFVGAFLGFLAGTSMVGIAVTSGYREPHQISPHSAAQSIAVGAGFGLTLSGLVSLSVIQGLRQERSEAFRKVTTSEKALTDLRKRLNSLQSDLAASAADNGRLLDELKQFSDAYERAAAANKSLSLSLDAKQKELMDLSGKNQELQALVDRDEAVFDAEMDKALADQAEDMQEAAEKASRERLKVHLHKINNAIPGAVRKRAQKEVDRVTRDVVAPLEAKVVSLQAERDALSHEIAELKTKVPGILASLEASFEDDEEARAYLATIEKLSTGIEERNRRIESLEQQVADLTRQVNEPRMFGDGSPLNRGNRLIAHAQEQGVLLDAVDRAVSPDKSIHTFRFINKFDQVPEDALVQLNRNAAKLRDALEALEPIQFRYNPETLLYYVPVTLNKRVLTRDDIDRLWLRASQFKKLVKGACAFRVSANKGGSKSPTVRNIFGAKLLQGEQFELRRYDPSAGSRKDFWRIAPTWNSYDQAIVMAYEILQVVRDRQAEKKKQPGIEFPWVYYVIDELDNTVADCNSRKVPMGEGEEVTESKVLMGAIAKAAKEGEHLNIGLVVCTQTPNVRQLMKDESIDKAFFNNFVQIIVEANVFDYLGASADGTKFADLTDRYRQVLDWCTEENESIEDEAKKYRPALFVGKNRRNIIQLPELGEFGFDKLEASESYDFESFNSYEFKGVKTLDQALGAVVALPVRSSPKQAQSSPKTDTGQAQSGFSVGLQESCTKSVVAISGELISGGKCPKCGGRLESSGIAQSGRYQGLRRLSCRNRKHPKQLGAKTFYVEVS